MTPEGSTRRLFLYVSIAMVMAAQNGAGVTWGFNWETVSYTLSIISAGLIAWRAYIDKSPSEILTPEPEPEKKAPYQ